MKKTIIIVAVWIFAAVSYAGAQQRLDFATMSRLFPKQVLSPEVHANGDVTFRMKAPGAKSVQLAIQLYDNKIDMIKDDEGVWSVTLENPAPDVYPYSFYVDGTQIADPTNAVINPNEGFKSSSVDIPNRFPTVQDVQNVPHGKVSYRWYHSGSLGFDRPLCVYTPADYDPAGDEKLPVLYLIHGMSHTEEAWRVEGRVNVILDNMIAAGRAERMIVVMPYANPFPEMKKRGIVTEYNVGDTEVFTNEIVSEIEPFVKENYAVSEGSANRAVAGFSLGGRQALACGLGNTDEFSFVAAFAPAIFGEEDAKQLVGSYDKDILNGRLKMLWIGCGTADFLYESDKAYIRALQDAGIRHTAYISTGGHSFMNCRDWLEIIATGLFM